MREYYVLFSCDEWKNQSSMSLVGVFTKTKLIPLLKERVKKGSFNFGRDLKEMNDMDINDIDISLEYGYIQALNINEILD